MGNKRKKENSTCWGSNLKLFFYNPDHDNDKLTWKSMRKIKIKL